MAHINEVSIAGVLLAIHAIPIAMSINTVRLVQSVDVPVVATRLTTKPSRVESERKEDTAPVRAVVQKGCFEKS